MGGVRPSGGHSQHYMVAGTWQVNSLLGRWLCGGVCFDYGVRQAAVWFQSQAKLLIGITEVANSSSQFRSTRESIRRFVSMCLLYRSVPLSVRIGPIWVVRRGKDVMNMYSSSEHAPFDDSTINIVVLFEGLFQFILICLNCNIPPM